MDPAQPKNKYLIFFKGVFISFAHPCGNPKIYLCSPPDDSTHLILFQQNTLTEYFFGIPKEWEGP